MKERMREGEREDRKEYIKNEKERATQTKGIKKKSKIWKRLEIK